MRLKLQPSLVIVTVANLLESEAEHPYRTADARVVV